MESTTNKKLPQPWHTKSFHLARFWMVFSSVCFLSVESVLEGKFPSAVGGAFFFLLFELTSLAAWYGARPDMQPLLTDGLFESQKQFKKLLWYLASMVGGFGTALYMVFCLVTDYQIQTLLPAIVLVGANLTGYFLMRWLSDVLVIVKQYRIGAVSVTPEFHAFSSPTSLTHAQPTPQSHAQRLRTGNGSRP